MEFDVESTYPARLSFVSLYDYKTDNGIIVDNNCYDRYLALA